MKKTVRKLKGRQRDATQCLNETRRERASLTQRVDSICKKYALVDHEIQIALEYAASQKASRESKCGDSSDQMLDWLRKREFLGTSVLQRRSMNWSRDGVVNFR
ncbi:unnamed protein product [Prunus armeniaca]|uniref:Uncharacterized protein n=1 Tax=Prunus armeniaca TaxID=36596 RepID=A0A6J5XKZ4_PRUAR|nr:unnamed protein product [Prunus armeniaca]